MSKRLLLEDDVIRAVDKHTIRDKLDNDISCILEEVKAAVVEIPPIFVSSNKTENKPVKKQKRVRLFENENVVLEQCGEVYYLSLYNNEGKFQREITIDVADDFEVETRNL